MASTAIDATLDALLALWRGALTEADSHVKVFDAEDDWASHEKTSILVGVRYDIDREELVGEVNGQQTFPNISTSSKSETLTIPHSILAWSGDVKVAGRRAQVLTLWQHLEAAHRDHNDLGITHATHPGITVMSSSFGSDFALNYLHTATGNAALLTWDVTVTTRLSHN
jgi:hypothetical protein